MWEVAQRQKEKEDKTKKASEAKEGARASSAPRLQLLAWIVATADYDSTELAVSSFATLSHKMRDDDLVTESLRHCLEKHIYDEDRLPLTVTDLAVIDSSDHRAILWNSTLGDQDVSRAVDLFKHNTTEREVYLVPRSQLRAAADIIKERIKETNGGCSPAGKLVSNMQLSYHARPGASRAGSSRSSIRRPNAFNLYLQWKKAQTGSTIASAEIAAEWHSLGTDGQAEWCQENGHLDDGILSEAAVSKYLLVLGRSVRLREDDEEDESGSNASVDGGDEQVRKKQRDGKRPAHYRTGHRAHLVPRQGYSRNSQPLPATSPVSTPSMSDKDTADALLQFNSLVSAACGMPGCMKRSGHEGECGVDILEHPRRRGKQ